MSSRIDNSMRQHMRKYAESRCGSPIKPGLLQSRKIRALDLAMRSEPKAQRHLDHLDLATDEDYFYVEASVAKTVFKSIIALNILEPRDSRALASVTKTTRRIATGQRTHTTRLRSKFTEKAIELIKECKAPFPKDFIRRLAKLDLGFALETAKSIKDPSQNDSALGEILDELLERAVKCAQEDLFLVQNGFLVLSKGEKDPLIDPNRSLYESSGELREAKEIFEKAITLASHLSNRTKSNFAFREILTAYLKVGLVEEALQLKGKIDDPSLQAFSAADIAAATPDQQQRENLFDEVIATASAPSTLMYVANKVVESNPRKASEILQSFYDKFDRHANRDQLIIMIPPSPELVKKGLLNEAIAIIDHYCHSDIQKKLYIHLAHTLIKEGLIKESLAVINKLSIAEIISILDDLLRQGETENVVRFLKAAMHGPTASFQVGASDINLRSFIGHEVFFKETEGLKQIEELAQLIQSPTEKIAALMTPGIAFGCRRQIEDMQRISMQATTLATETQGLRDQMRAEGYAAYTLAINGNFEASEEKWKEIFKQSGESLIEGLLTILAIETALEFIKNNRLNEFCSLIKNSHLPLRNKNHFYIELGVKLDCLKRLEDARSVYLYAFDICHDDSFEAEKHRVLGFIVRIGLPEEAYKRVEKISSPQVRTKLLCAIANGTTKKDPHKGLRIFDEAIAIAETLEKKDRNNCLTEISNFMHQLGFPSSIIESRSQLPTRRRTFICPHACKFAKVDLEAAEEVFQVAITASCQDEKLQVADYIAEVGLSEEKQLEKTLETYEVVAAHYAMEVFKAEQKKDNTRLSQLALRQAAYDPQIGLATCNKIPDPQKKAETLTRIAVMRSAVA